MSKIANKILDRLRGMRNIMNSAQIIDFGRAINFIESETIKLAKQIDKLEKENKAFGLLKTETVPED